MELLQAMASKERALSAGDKLLTVLWDELEDEAYRSEMLATPSMSAFRARSLRASAEWAAPMWLNSARWLGLFGSRTLSLPAAPDGTGCLFDPMFKTKPSIDCAKLSSFSFSPSRLFSWEEAIELAELKTRTTSFVLPVISYRLSAC